MGYKTSPCVFCVNDKLVFIASNPPCRHSCYEKSVLHMLSEPSSLHIVLKPFTTIPLPFLPVLLHIFYRCILPRVPSLRRPELSSFPCSECLSVLCFLSKLKGGLGQFQLLGQRKRGRALHPAVSLSRPRHTSCSYTSWEAVPADTSLHKQ